MTKEELVGITLKKLIDHFRSSPESFDYVDSERRPAEVHYPTIFWQPKVQLNDYMSTVIQDPNNTHAVAVCFNPSENSVTCYVFLKAPSNLASSSAAVGADCVTTSCRWFEKWRGNYRKFERLRNLIVERDKHKENLNYLKKLSSVFPDSMDDHFLDR
jgi:hypothetical protein